ncbi:serine/threonine-protein kinase MARK2 isoform X2 [Octopus bimaculoides]|uniref:serine/threonine-protein kinase MARK2 isoform X2 n=1 Tax=Octopus bimaculoides TaxID=37653 RepID=UPI0022E4917D|nr:serine/threonine-protein kinase MARK2 isoform X2 [Octopus bimaculoides]
MGKKIQCIGRYVMEGQTLGKGTFARVELASHSITGCKVAIKIIDTRKLKEEYMRTNLHREARILGQLRHPNIIRLYETLKAATLYCVCMEYAAGGELYSFIKIHPENRLPEDRARPYIRQIISAVHYLHERGVAHRDLKMENIMLDEKKKNIKIVDFGLSNTFSKDNLMKTHCGSPEYAAPELFNPSEKYGPEIDIWSLGIIFYTMLVGKLPFTTPSSDQFRRRELQSQIEKGLVNCHFKEMMHLTPGISFIHRDSSS